jgi:S-DNA-T family DNA segregation ATPase FtsK/SpoIIIE
MGRRKKKHVTYDSKETKTMLGLLCMLLSIIFLISIFVEKQENTIFTKVYNIFGSSSIFTAAFLADLSLHYLGATLPFTKMRSLIAQLALVFILPAFMTSFTNTPRTIDYANASDVAGGYIGYYVVDSLLGDSIPTQPATTFILLLTVLILAPLALSMSLSKIVDIIASAIGWIVNALKVFLGIGQDYDEKDKDKLNPELPEKAATFGDFNKLLQAKQAEKLAKQPVKPIEPKPNMAMASRMPRTEDADGVSIKEGKLDEEGLKQERLHFPGWQLPPLSLLIPFKRTKPKEAAITQNAQIIEQILASFGIAAKVEDAYIGPSVVQYALNIPLGINVKKIGNLSENIALALGVDSKAVRIESIPETTYLGIEVPRTNRDMVRFKELMESDEKMTSSFALPVPIGKDINGKAVIGDIQKMPHLLIAGATGSGKSVLTNSFITSLIMSKTPDELKLILVDPKRVEFSDYNGIAHLLTPVITDMEKVLNALKWAVGEMDRRYIILEKEGVKEIKSYNQKKGFSAMPYIVIVIDEMADMMMTANRVETETAIVRLAQKARAVGIHLVLATQRPSVNVITGIIKANIPGRVGMSVTSSMDSRVILDRIGAESLQGNGDLLYKAPDKTKSTRLQGSFVDGEEIVRVVDFIKSQAPEVEYVSEILEKHQSPEEQAQEVLEDISEDNLVEQAIRVVVQYQKGSASFLQRRLNIGFNRAARLLDELEVAGVVGPANGSKPRDVLISDADQFITGMRSSGEIME